MKHIKITSKKTLAQRRLKMIKEYIGIIYIYAAAAVFTIWLICWLISLTVTAINAAKSGESTEPVKTVTITAEEPERLVNEHIEESEEPAPFFELTTEQRTLIEQVVSAEARGEPFEGQIAVAQCILNACQKDGLAPEQAIKKYKYTGARAEPTISVKEAVEAVFDRGEIITDEPIIYFYSPDRVHSEFHESQIFVTEIANHKFFKEDTRK